MAVTVLIFAAAAIMVFSFSVCRTAGQSDKRIEEIMKGRDEHVS